MSMDLLLDQCNSFDFGSAVAWGDGAITNLSGFFFFFLRSNALTVGFVSEHPVVQGHQSDTQQSPWHECRVAALPSPAVRFGNSWKSPGSPSHVEGS